MNDFHRALNLSLGFRNYVLDTLSARMSDIVDLVSDIAFRRLDLRLACMLGQRFERSAGAPIRITHEELAHELGTTREVVSRILKAFERQECVSLSRGCIFLGDAEGLRWFGRKREPHSA